MGGGVTVRQILENKVLAGSRVLAGEAGLDREVWAVTVAEIPDISDWLQSEDFVHSVVRFMVNEDGEVDEQRFCDWVRSLRSRGASCLAIKTKRYIDEIPQKVLDIGDELAFPIIELPLHGTQNEVTEAVMQMVLESELNSKKRSADVFIHLCDKISNGCPMNEIADYLTEYLGNPVLIEGTKLQYLASTSRDHPSFAQILLDRRRKDYLTEFCGILNPNQWIRTSFLSAGRTYYQETWPIRFQNMLFGYITVCELNVAIEDTERDMLEMCLGAIAIGMNQQRSQKEKADWRAKEDFMSVLAAKEYDDETASYRADLIGIDYRQPCTAMVISTNQNEQSDWNGQEHYHYEDSLIYCICDFLTQNQMVYVLCGYHNRFIVFIRGSFRDRQKIKKLAVNLETTLKAEFPREKFAIGIGAEGSGLKKWRESYFAALDVVRCIRSFGMKENVLLNSELGHYELLLTVTKDEEAARRYCESILGAMLEYERENNSSLIETLDVYLGTNCSYAETGRRMYLHVNTVKYRIRRIKELLPVDLSSLDGRSTVWIALNLVYYFRNKERD